MSKKFKDKNLIPDPTPQFVESENQNEPEIISDPDLEFKQGETAIPDVTKHEIVEKQIEKVYSTTTNAYILPTPYGEYVITKEFVVTDTGLQKFIESTPEFNSGKIYLKN